MRLVRARRGRRRHPGGNRGFSLPETLVAVVLLGIVATILYRMLVGTQRIHRAQVQEAAMSESTRAALAILSAEFRELSAGDGDILVMDSTAITFKSVHALHVLCTAPDTAARTVFLDGMTVYGSSSLPVPDDSILVFAEGDPFTRVDDTWLSAATSGTAVGEGCPGGRPSIAVILGGVTASQLMGVGQGAPVRTFRPAQVLAYQDGNGDWWLGQRQFQAVSGSWSIVQPVLGPLSPAGLTLGYVDAAGIPTGVPHRVSRIAIRVEARSPERVHRPTGATYLARDATTDVALRNNPRY